MNIGIILVIALVFMIIYLISNNLSKPSIAKTVTRDINSVNKVIDDLSKTMNLSSKADRDVYRDVVNLMQKAQEMPHEIRELEERAVKAKEQEELAKEKLEKAERGYAEYIQLSKQAQERAQEAVIISDQIEHELEIAYEEGHDDEIEHLQGKVLKAKEEETRALENLDKIKKNQIEESQLIEECQKKADEALRKSQDAIDEFQQRTNASIFDIQKEIHDVEKDVKKGLELSKQTSKDVNDVEKTVRHSKNQQSAQEVIHAAQNAKKKLSEQEQKFKSESIALKDARDSLNELIKSENYSRSDLMKKINHIVRIFQEIEKCNFTQDQLEDLKVSESIGKMKHEMKYDEATKALVKANGEFKKRYIAETESELDKYDDFLDALEKIFLLNDKEYDIEYIPARRNELVKKLEELGWLLDVFMDKDEIKEFKEWMVAFSSKDDNVRIDVWKKVKRFWQFHVNKVVNERTLLSQVKHVH